MRYAFLGFTAPTVTCKNPDCQSEFILYAVFRGDDGDDTVLSQVLSPFCPYCGHMQPRETPANDE